MRYGTNDQVYEFDPVPGNHQIVVSHSMFIYPDRRGQGKSYDAGRERLLKAQSLGYDYIICTVDQNNEAQLKQLSINDWTWLSSFDNRRTGHHVRLYGRRLYLPVMNRVDNSIKIPDQCECP